MAKGWFDFILPPPPYIFVKGTFNFCKLPQINGPKFKNAAQTKPPAGSVLGSGPGAGGTILPVQSPNSAEQADEEAAPAHDPNPKNSKAPERYAPGPAVIFYGKKSCFPGRCGAYYLGSAVTTMKRTVVCFP